MDMTKKRIQFIKNMMRLFGSFLIAPVIGSIMAIPFGVILDAAYQRTVTGSPWHLTFPNTLYAAMMGLFTGLAAGIIAGRKGWLIGALAQFGPLTLLVIVSIAVNRNFQLNTEVSAATWTWIGLLPAIVGGYVGERAMHRGMGADLLWFLPICFGITSYFEVENIVSACKNLAPIHQRFTWAIMVSPAAALFIGATLGSIWVPPQILLISFSLFDSTKSWYPRRYQWSGLAIFAIVVLSILQQIIVWGSFPLPADPDGAIRLRLIPFIPWPTPEQ